MKRLIQLLLCAVLSLSLKAQSEEAQQLLLNVEKLAQFTKMLKSMYDAYKILYKGYTAVKDISEGNFRLHKNFLDGLLLVSPAVSKYKRVADILRFQTTIAREIKNSTKRLNRSGLFADNELRYLQRVYARLIKESIKKLDELILVITAGELRMTDDERLNSIDRIYLGVEEQVSFLNNFNSSTSILLLQRQHSKAEILHSKKILGY